MKKIMLTVLFAFLSTALFAQIPVTFQVDMGVQVFKGNFTPGTDIVVVRGSFQEDAGDPGGNWQGGLYELTDGDGDTIYTVTVNLPSDSAGKHYEFKYVLNTDGWESVDNRSFDLTGPSQILPAVYFNDDNDYTLLTNTITFEADLSQILGIGAGGAFDPAQDSIQVMGLDWVGGQGVTGVRRMEQDPFNPSVFTATLTVQKTSDSTSWKFKAFPDARFSGGGWETGDDRWYVYGPDGTNANIGPIVPRIFPLFGPLSQDVNVRFQVDVTNAVNRYNQMPIDPASLEFVGLRGGADWLGSWVSGGNWLPGDTTDGHMKVLNDDGINGDDVAGDNIWTISLMVPAGTDAGAFEYKFAANYPGADTVNGGSSPLDNEGAAGHNHLVILVDGPDIEHFLRFGDFTTTSVDQTDNQVPESYSLSQNYPNPFNPSTKITFSLSKAEHVVLKIFNLLGQQVDVLLDNDFNFGTYEVNFDASQLSSGVYFYTLEAGNFSATKKMILMK